MEPLEIAGLAVTLIGSMLGFLAIARRLSGKIATSEAGALWEAQETFRKDLAVQLLQRDERILSLEGRAAKVESSRFELQQENWELKRKQAACEETVTALQRELERLREGK